MHAQWPQLCPCLWDPMDYSPPGSSVHGTDSPGKNTGWVAMPSPGDLPDPGAELTSLMSPASASRFFTMSAAWEALG